MTKTQKELIEMTEIIYGKDSEITNGFKALCAAEAVPDAHLKIIAWYMGVSKTEVLLKQDDWSNRNKICLKNA